MAMTEAAQAAVSHNPAPRPSGNLGISRAKKRHLQLAAHLAKTLGIVPTWPNVQTIRLAIESEAALTNISPEQAAAVILSAAKEFIPLSNAHAPNWAVREISRLNTVDRFWFEDARWRCKQAYTEFLGELAR